MPKSAKQRMMEQDNINLPDAIKVNRFPWDEPEEINNWNREDIFNYLREIFYIWGVTREQAAGSLVEALADSYFSLMIARQAIDKDPINPIVGRQSAYTLQRASISQIHNSFKYLGVYPLDTVLVYPKTEEELEKESKQKKEEEERLSEERLLLGDD